MYLHFHARWRQLQIEMTNYYENTLLLRKYIISVAATCWSPWTRHAVSLQDYFHFSWCACGAWRLLRRLDSVDAPRNDPKRIVVGERSNLNYSLYIVQCLFHRVVELLRYPDFIVTSSQRQKLCTLLWRFLTASQ